MPARRPYRRARPRRRIRGAVTGVLALAAVASLAAGCGTRPAVDPSHTLPTPAHRSLAHATSAPAAAATTAPATADPAPAAVRSCPDVMLARMTEAQRIGQLFLVGLPGNQVRGPVAAAITAHHYGSAIFGANSTGGVAGARQVASAVQALAGPATAGVKFFVAANQEGGEVQALTGPGISSIPPALSQGSAHVSTLRKRARIWGDQLRAAGVNLNLAPVLDVVPPGTDAGNAPIGALQREYGHDPAIVASHGVAFLHGMAGAGVATSAKHFPGLGRVQGNTDFTSSVVDSSTTAGDPYLQTYQAAIDAGVPLVMVALATYTRIDPRHPAVFSATIMDGLLRSRMKFRGTIVSDDMGAAAAVAGVSPAARAVDFIAAGGDLITTESLPAAGVMDAALLRRAGADRDFRAQVDSAARHVLQTKQAYGLLPCSK
ncbi:MAG TPA: glycoside hydrolase family 3 N-terminal domain-containing protein [Streptosporangiaceae bacterium]